MDIHTASDAPAGHQLHLLQRLIQQQLAMNWMRVAIVLSLFLLGQACKDKNCVFCPVSEECQKCEEGFKVEAGGCKQCYDSNCVACHEKYSRCQLCKDGFRVAATTCEKCKDPACRRCDKRYSICNECKAPYTLRDGACWSAEL